MTFFDEVKRGLASTGKQVINKTRELTDTVQLKTLIAGEKENLLKLYAQIGRQIFDDDQAVDQTRFAREFEQIRKTLARKKMLEEQLSNVDGCMLCPECGARIEKDARFCSFCGEKIQPCRNESEETREEAQAEEQSEKTQAEEEQTEEAFVFEDSEEKLV